MGLLLMAEITGTPDALWKCLTETMTSEEIRLLRERNRPTRSNPFVIMLVFAGVVAGLVSLGSQSSQRNAQAAEKASVSGLFTKP
jgi:hypothetical protein